MKKAMWFVLDPIVARQRLRPRQGSHTETCETLQDPQSKTRASYATTREAEGSAIHFVEQPLKIHVVVSTLVFQRVDLAGRCFWVFLAFRKLTIFEITIVQPIRESRQSVLGGPTQDLRGVLAVKGYK